MLSWNTFKARLTHWGHHWPRPVKRSRTHLYFHDRFKCERLTELQPGWTFSAVRSNKELQPTSKVEQTCDDPSSSLQTRECSETRQNKSFITEGFYCEDSIEKLFTEAPLTSNRHHGSVCCTLSTQATQLPGELMWLICRSQKCWSKPSRVSTFVLKNMWTATDRAHLCLLWDLFFIVFVFTTSVGCCHMLTIKPLILATNI